MSGMRVLMLSMCFWMLQASASRGLAEPPYQVSLEDEQGRKLRTFAHRGQVFAMGEHGRRYNVRVTNRTGRRIEAVVTVDGRDVLSGRPGDYRTQRGYVLPPHGSVLIDGFRTSLSEVAAFRFSDPGESYSSRMGTPQNVGVIGAAIFVEALPPPAPPMIPRRYEEPGASRGAPTAPAAPSAESTAPQQRSAARADTASERASNIGTQYGERRTSEVSETEFRRARPTHPDRVISMRYDDREGLEARGIRTRPREEAVGCFSAPLPFPANAQDRFAPPPPPRGTF